MSHLIVSPRLTADGACHAPDPFTLKWGVTNTGETDQDYHLELSVHDDRAGSGGVLMDQDNTCPAGGTQEGSYTYSPEAPGEATYVVQITPGESDSLHVICTGDPSLPIA